MSKENNIRKRLETFVRQLSIDECYRQLVLAYMQMERCQQVLRGEDVEPVEMRDNGLSSDLELFYLCKKVREELDYVKGDEFGNKIVDDIPHYLFGSQEKAFKYLQEGLDKAFEDFISKYGGKDREFQPDKKTIEAIKRYSRKFIRGDKVWYMLGDRVQHGAIDYPMEGSGDMTTYMTEEGHIVLECETFRTLDQLLDYLKTTSVNHLKEESDE